MTFQRIKDIKINEADFMAVESVAGYESVTFHNRSDAEIDANALVDHFMNLKGTEEIKHLIIGWSSNLRNVEIVRAFPCIRTLEVAGHIIESLDGLEWFSNSQYLSIPTDDKHKHKRNIGKIAEVPIEIMDLDFARKADYEAIGRCTSLKSLTVNKGIAIDLYEWRDVPLEYVKFMQGKFTELGDIGYLKELESIMIAGCRKFERFVGTNTKVKHVIVYGCKRFDVKSLSAFPAAEYITINNGPPDFPLSDLPENSSVRSLSILNCNIIYDMYDIKSKMPKLEDLTISRSKLKKDQAQLLRDANPGLEVK